MSSTQQQDAYIQSRIGTLMNDVRLLRSRLLTNITASKRRRGIMVELDIIFMARSQEEIPGFHTTAHLADFKEPRAGFHRVDFILPVAHPKSYETANALLSEFGEEFELIEEERHGQPCFVLKDKLP